MKEDRRVKTLISHSGMRIFAILCGGFILSGCVLSEKYEAEKARSLNFQRLLSQEEKRTAELDNEVKRSKKELAEYEARNRELTAQVQAVREQMSRVQEESEAIKEAALLERKARADMKRAAPVHKAPPVEAVPNTGDLMGSGVTGMPDEAAASAQTEALAAAPSHGSPTIHVVKPGETLYRISRRYGVRLETLRKWNKLPDDIIEVGQKLIVGQE
ncbi:MAG: LysM peptidoglycan-binding domain-containing protein [Nitrospira sp. CR1.3]|nr:LysM peptidoglycan-binding domain-containing protein [Nitrospira sp. CR1.3]